MKSVLSCRVLMLLALLGSACGSSGSFQELVQDAEAAELSLERETGTRPEIGFNITNGRLDIVTGTFQSSELRTVGVHELERVVSGAIARHFREKPHEVTLVIVLAADSAPQP